MSLRILTPLLLALTALTGCVSTDIDDLERHPDFLDARYARVVVHCSAEDDTQRAIIESAVAEKLRNSGYEADPSYRLAGSRKGREFQVEDVPGYDALVWIGFGTYENVVTEYPGYVETWSGVSFGYHGHRGRRGRWHGGYGWAPSFGVTYHAPQRVSKWWLRTRIELIDAATERKVFSARAATRTTDAESLEAMAADLGGEVVRLMSRHRAR
ncbi:MAG: hypothetical protein R3F20_00260 [Planctomycetota bacterium]